LRAERFTAREADVDRCWGLSGAGRCTDRADCDREWWLAATWPTSPTNVVYTRGQRKKSSVRRMPCVVWSVTLSQFFRRSIQFRGDVDMRLGEAWASHSSRSKSPVVL